MRVREIMTTPVIAVSAQATVEEAARELLARGFTTLPVVDQTGRLLGLVTEAELGLSRLGLGLRGRNDQDDGVLLGLARRTVGTVMTPAGTLDADSDVADAARRFVRERHRCLPVVDGSLVVGMLSWRDLLRAMLLNQAWPR